ncbi:MAG TPA: aspartate kinase, partial [Salinimicrobium sp.]|nr:aspartate kinase [Salinimicrobium sp.]
MRIFKFGGASVKDAEGVKNVLRVLETTGFKDKLIVVSAMGKTTNALENVVNSYLKNGNFKEDLQEVKNYHFSIAEELFENPRAEVFERLKYFFGKLENFLENNKSTKH